MGCDLSFPHWIEVLEAPWFSMRDGSLVGMSIMQGLTSMISIKCREDLAWSLIRLLTDHAHLSGRGLTDIILSNHRPTLESVRALKNSTSFHLYGVHWSRIFGMVRPQLSIPHLDGGTDQLLTEPAFVFKCNQALSLQEIEWLKEEFHCRGILSTSTPSELALRRRGGQ